ncbi:MAG: DUF2207 domain-containing protein [Thermomicrobiales bacterium]
MEIAAGSGFRIAQAVGWLVLAAVLLGFAAPARAADEPASRFVWDEVSVTVRLQDDGALHVREHDTVRFTGGPFRQGYREIPLAAIENISQIAVAEVIDGVANPYTSVPRNAYSRMAPHTYTYQRVGTMLRIEWSFPPTTNGTRAFVIEYLAEGALRVYDNAEPPYQEISWMAVDSVLTRDAPVNQATLIFILPHPVDPAATVAEGDGTPFGGEDGQTWVWRAEHLGPGDTLGASLQFPPLVQASKPDWQDTHDRQLSRDASANLVLLGLALLTAVGGSVGLLAAWWFRGRDPQPGLVPDRLNAPPDDTPPGVVGALLDEQVDERDYVATLIDLGRRGVVRITSRVQPVVSRKQQMVVTLLEPDAPLAPFERELLVMLFAKAWWRHAQVNLPLDDPAGMEETLQRVKNLLYGELVQRGYFTAPPPGTRETWRYAGALLWFLAVTVLLLGKLIVSSLVWPLLASLALAALGTAVFLVSRHMPRKTRAGAEAAARWQAFRRYMEAVDRLDAQHGGQEGFERYLPYAVVFGIQEPWIDAFARATASAPAWHDLVNLDGDWPRTTWRSGTRVPVPTSGLGLPDLPDVGGLQGMSSLASSSLQASSSTLYDLFNEVGDAFNPEKVMRNVGSAAMSPETGELALKIGLTVLRIALSSGKGRSGGGGGGFW